MSDEINIDITPQNIAVNVQAQEIHAEMEAYEIRAELSGGLVPTGTVNNSAIFEAGEIVSALKVIRISALGRAVKASSANLADINRAIAVAVTAAIQGQNLISVTAGEIENAFWNWMPSAPIFLGLDGTLTQTPPDSGFLQIIGNAETATKMKVNIQQGVLLVAL
jgi:hypothetical protein